MANVQSNGVDRCDVVDWCCVLCGDLMSGSSDVVKCVKW